MEWRASAILLSCQRLGEANALIDVFAAEHGRHAGVVPGGASRKKAPMLQPGTQLDVTWRARLEEHIGSITAEPIQSRAASLLQDRLGLAALTAVTALLKFCTPERDPHPELYHATVALLDQIAADDPWLGDYIQWERRLLEAVGYGLDLEQCAVTGGRTDLTFVSPRSGRAVCTNAAGEWAARLLPLTGALRGTSDDGAVEALKTTGYFLERKLAVDLGNKPLPAARQRLVDQIIALSR